MKKSMNPAGKYAPFPVLDFSQRQWPNRRITKAPIWCSVCLRDGNQALVTSMNVEQKLELFHALVDVGFEEIEVGFPSATGTEFDFNRKLIDEGHIPDDVTIQCLVQAREDLIEKTILSLIGAKNVIIHLYNSTSPAQRRVVFRTDKEGVIKMAVDGARMIMERIHRLTGTNVRIEYSPESFSATEVEFAVEVCDAVMRVVEPTAANPIILNLPATVEVATPNVYADQIETFIRLMSRKWPRKCFLVSLHTHNDRNTGTAATELGLLAGADRVEGTLFGNGERTGNLDLVTVALNMFSQGIDPELDLRNLAALADVFMRCTGMTIPDRHPYAGKLVFTAFSGSHQDAIKKGFAEWQEREGKFPWDIPYLLIDPADVGRTYDEVIRVNSQSGKGGISFVLQQKFGIMLPRGLEVEFGAIANGLLNARPEATPEELKEWLFEYYRNPGGRLELKRAQFRQKTETQVNCQVTLGITGKNDLYLKGRGVGTIASFENALSRSTTLWPFKIEHFSAHMLEKGGSSAEAISYVQISLEGSLFFGVGVDVNTELAPMRAIVAALNRAEKAMHEE